MAKIDMEELKLDRELGTPGPWHHGADGRIIYDPDGWAVANAVTFHQKHMGDQDRVNARRIARLPDLEAAFLEAVGLLRNAMSIVENCVIEDGFCCCGDDMQRHSDPMTCGHSPVDHGGYVAQQFHDAARIFLGGE